MSYILDALRKSDQKRQRGATPTLLMAQVTAAETRAPVNWVHGLIATVLVGAGVVIGWLHPWQSEPQSRERIPRGVVAVKPPESSPRETGPTPVAPGSTSPEVTRRRAQELPQTSTAQAAPDTESSGPTKARHGPVPSLSDARTPGMPSNADTAVPGEAPTPVPEKSLTAGLTGLAPGQRAMTMGELPLSVRDELPGMQISLHLYSTRPKNSFVNINGRMLQEGEDLAPGIRLEQITPDGMIFTYKGYRFRRGVQ